MSIWDEIDNKTHEYLAWRAYDNKHVYALASLPSKKLQTDFDKEVKRGPEAATSVDLYKDLSSRRSHGGDCHRGDRAARRDELLAIWLPRKHLEVWNQTSTPRRLVVGTLVRCMQLINNVLQVAAQMPAPLLSACHGRKLGKEMVDVALRGRAHRDGQSAHRPRCALERAVHLGGSSTASRCRSTSTSCGRRSARCKARRRSRAIASRRRI